MVSHHKRSNAGPAHHPVTENSVGQFGLGDGRWFVTIPDLLDALKVQHAIYIPQTVDFVPQRASLPDTRGC